MTVTCEKYLHATKEPWAQRIEMLDPHVRQLFEELDIENSANKMKNWKAAHPRESIHKKIRTAPTLIIVPTNQTSTLQSLPPVKRKDLPAPRIPPKKRAEAYQRTTQDDRVEDPKMQSFLQNE